MLALAEKALPFPSAENLWANALGVIRQDGKTYALTWIEKLQPLGFRSEALVLGVPERGRQFSGVAPG